MPGFGAASDSFRSIRQWLLPILDPAGYVDTLVALEEQEKQATAPPDNARQLLERLQWHLSRKLKNIHMGSEKSLLRGQGLDFANLREYTPGDDIRKIDWNVFARTFTPHIREHHEEKQLTVWIVADLTPSMLFGHRKNKARQLLDLAGLIALLAGNAGHKLGLFCFDGKERLISRPTAGQPHMQGLIKTLLQQYEAGKSRPFEHPLEENLMETHCFELSKLVQKRSFVFFLSDFLSGRSGWEKSLGNLSRHSMVSCLMLVDPVEQVLPEEAGLLDVFDPETGGVVTLDCTDPEFRADYVQKVQEEQQYLITTLSMGARVELASTETDPVDTLVRLFRPGGRA